MLHNAPWGEFAAAMLVELNKPEIDLMVEELEASGIGYYCKQFVSQELYWGDLSTKRVDCHVVAAKKHEPMIRLMANRVKTIVTLSNE